MKVSVVDKDYNYFIKKVKPVLKGVDLILFSHKTMPSISYELEILGKTNTIKNMLALSKELKTIVLMPSKYKLLDFYYNSVLICDKGEFVGIFDIKQNNLSKNSFVKTLFAKDKKITLILGKLNDLTGIKEADLVINFEAKNKNYTSYQKKLKTKFDCDIISVNYQEINLINKKSKNISFV